MKAPRPSDISPEEPAEPTSTAEPAFRDNKWESCSQHLRRCDALLFSVDELMTGSNEDAELDRIRWLLDMLREELDTASQLFDDVHLESHRALNPRGNHMP